VSLPFIVCAAITAASALVSLGFSIAAVLDSDHGAETMALYACARSLAFALLSAVPFLTGSTPWLLAVASGMTIVQACDAAIGARINRTKTLGPGVLALANLAAMIWLLG
jgi:hypothetical protein